MRGLAPEPHNTSSSALMTTLEMGRRGARIGSHSRGGLRARVLLMRQRGLGVIAFESALCLSVGATIARDERATLLVLALMSFMIFLAVAPRSWIATMAIATTFISVTTF